MSKYKLSNYNHYIFYRKGNMYLIYNAISNGLAKLEPEVYRLIRSGEQGLDKLERDESKRQLLDSLRSGHIIVEKEFDEIEFLRAKMNMGRFGSTVLSLTIVPTLACNLKCVYCYEGVKIGKYMDESIEDAITNFTESQIRRFGYRGLTVSWYGGEPLMHLKAIYSLSRKLINLCRRKRVNYQAMVVTNGTILNKTIARRLKACKVTHIQVTIDGPKETHDVRRPFISNNKSSFDTIVRNVERVLGILPVHIRINVDRTNYEQSLELVEEMKNRGWLDESKNCLFYIGYTREWTSVCSNIASQCFTMEEFSKAELEFQKELISRGFRLSNLYPSQYSYCVATSPAGFVIDPHGELYKCWADVGNREAYLGNVKEPLEMNAKLLEWLSYEPLLQFPECRVCKFFPICAGGCPYVALKQRGKFGRNYNCTPWKILMRKKMEVFLEQLAEAQSTQSGGQNEMAS